MVDVVVVSYNSRATLRDCVEPLARLDEARVFVVDNASPDLSPEAVEDLPITLLRLEQNHGFAYACNRGWKAGSAPFVLFLNPDALIDASSLRKLRETLEQDRSAGVAAPRILDEEGNLEFSLRRFPRLRSTYAQALFLHRLFPRSTWADELIRDPPAYARPGYVEWVSGACILVRRDLLEQLGGWDEGFFMYSEDKDLCRRTHDAGSEVSFVPEAVALHVGGVSAPRSTLLPVLAASRLRYARKHHGRFYALLERAGIALGACTHMFAARGGRRVRAGHARALVWTTTDAEPPVNLRVGRLVGPDSAADRKFTEPGWWSRQYENSRVK